MARKNASKLKPRPDFPLTPHASGRWRKIHKGRPHWFGPLDDPEGAEARYRHQWPYILKGLRPPPMPGEDEDIEYTTLRDAINLFLEMKDGQRDTGELSDRMFHDYTTTAKLILEAVDGNRDIESIDLEDFILIRKRLAKDRGLVSLGNHITRARSIFKFTIDDGIRREPLHYGQRFSKPKAKSLRIEKRQRPDKTFTADQCRRLIDAAPNPLRAMILLGLNAGYGNQDIADLNLADIKTGELSVARGKTGAPRRAMLWPETVAALEAALEVRGTPKPEAEKAVFVTAYGNRWRRTAVSGADDGHKLKMSDAVTRAFVRVLDELKLRVDGRGFYGLRHTYRTTVDSLNDRAAVDLTMGHDDLQDMRGRYVRPESIDTARLQAVADHMRAWLFGEEGGEGE